MISQGKGFITRHRSGLFFRSHWNVETEGRARCHIPGTESITYSLTADPLECDMVYQREGCGRFLTRPEWVHVADQWEVISRPGCVCCGEEPRREGADPNNYRCWKHQDRNPCAIEGCQRTTAAKGHYASSAWLCSEHWRRYVPPHSPARRAYRRLFRLAKKTGWTPDLKRRFWRFWDGLVARARRQSTEGRLDVDEINKLFGWDDAA